MHPQTQTPHNLYRRLSQLIDGETLPLALVDLDAFDRNVQCVVTLLRGRHKTLRVASKSLRCMTLIRRVFEQGGEIVRGIMSYSTKEAQALVEAGFDDVLVAYPSARKLDAALLAELKRHADVSIVVNEVGHISTLAAAGKASGLDIPLVIEFDVSLRLGAAIHLGARRSPLVSVDRALALADHIRDTAGVRLHGVMAYESQVAGLVDDSPFSPLLNPPKRMVKLLSRSPIERARRELWARRHAHGHTPQLFNGGGTGSLEWSSREASLTEVTAGSGFAPGHLFDYYRDLEFEPTTYFAVQVVRNPCPGLITCHGGGYVASGETIPDRQPRPVLPVGLELLPAEGAGEVQTPLRLPPGLTLPLGAPVFMRHAKAGEVAERFDSYLLVRGNAIEDRVLTYRGEGWCFL